MGLLSIGKLHKIRFTFLCRVPLAKIPALTIKKPNRQRRLKRKKDMNAMPNLRKTKNLEEGVVSTMKPILFSQPLRKEGGDREQTQNLSPIIKISY